MRAAAGGARAIVFPPTNSRGIKMWTQRAFSNLKSLTPRVAPHGKKCDQGNAYKSLHLLAGCSTTTRNSSILQRPFSTAYNHPPLKESSMLGIAAAVGAVGFALGLGKLYWDASSSYVPVEDMRHLLVGMINAVTQITLELQRAKAEALEKDPDADKEALNKEMQQKFYFNVSRLEEQIMQSMGVTADGFNESLKFHLENDTELQQLMGQLQATMQQSMAALVSPPVKVPVTLTCKKLLGILQELSDMTMVVLKETLDELKSQGVSNYQEPNVWSPIYQKRTDARVGEILKTHELNQEVLLAAMLKYEKNPDFVKHMEEMQQAQKKEFEELNIEL